MGHGAEIESSIQGENKKVSGCGIGDRRGRRREEGGRTRRIGKGSQDKVKCEAKKGWKKKKSESHE